MEDGLNRIGEVPGSTLVTRKIPCKETFMRKTKKKQTARGNVILLRDLDGRSKQSKRFNAIVTDIVFLVGETDSPEIVKQLARQYAGLILVQEKYLSALLEDRPADNEQYMRLVNCSTRTLKVLGLVPGEVTDDDNLDDDLSKYLEKQRKKDGRRERLKDF